MRFALLLTVMLALVAGQQAKAQSTTDVCLNLDGTQERPPVGSVVFRSKCGVSDMGFYNFRDLRKAARIRAHNKLEHRCRPHGDKAHFDVGARKIAPWVRGDNIIYWRHKNRKWRELSSKCLHTPVDIGRYLAAKMYGWTRANGQWFHLYTLFNRESGWNPCRHYPSMTDCNYTGPNACGIPQFVPCSKLLSGCGATLGTCSVWTQIRKGLSYIRYRYGSPLVADIYQMSHNYY